jgi:hypothetical protein
MALNPGMVPGMEIDLKTCRAAGTGIEIFQNDEYQHI